MKYILLGCFALILIVFTTTKVLRPKRKLYNPIAQEFGSIDIENLLEGAELVAHTRDEKLFLSTTGQWLIIHQQNNRLDYLSLTPWKAKKYILDHMRKINPDNYYVDRDEILKTYNLTGDKNNLHLPYANQMKQGKMIIENCSKMN